LEPTASSQTEPIWRSKPLAEKFLLTTDLKDDFEPTLGCSKR
jgi:hypothetical protein